jgi:hypothetical protein
VLRRAAQLHVRQHGNDARNPKNMAAFGQSQWIKAAFVLGAMLFVTALYWGTRLPWLRTEWTWYARMYVAFPLMVALLAYMSFVGKLPNGRTALQTMTERVHGFWKRASTTFWIIAGVFLIDLQFLLRGAGLGGQSRVR